jgi:hypothetical protein
MGNRFKSVKLFDCRHMSDDVRELFFKRCGSPSFTGGNDCVVEWSLWGKTGSKVVSGKKPYKMKNCKGEEIPYDELNYNEILDDSFDEDTKNRYVIQKGDCIVSDWLLDNGAEMFEEVLIKHWW